MIIMIVSDHPDAERKRIVESARSQAAYHTDEQWRFIESGSVEELKRSIGTADRADLICLDLTMDGSLPMAEVLRQDNANAYMILIADADISPVKYLRPSIRAESLMLKPLRDNDINDVISEAVIGYAGRLSSPDEKKVFVAESKGSRNLIEYSRILFFESREKKVFLSTEREEYGFYDTLDELEEKLDDTFIRCHRSFIVNSARISRVEISAGRIFMDDGTEIPLSRKYKAALKDHVRKHKS